MLKAYELPEWQPDLANNVLTEAVNVKPIANGYAPVKALQSVTSALAAKFNGGGAFIGSDGNSTLLAATASNVYKYTGSAWSLVSAIASTQVHRFAQFGDNILIATGSSNTLRSYGLISTTVSTPTSAPNLIDVAQVRDFVMGITTDNAYQWSQFNNSGDWTTGANQADKQPILSSSGVRIIGGEYAIGLKKQGIDRLTYVGGDIVFQIDSISNEVGCMAGGSVANVGRMVFFLSERGFMLCDGAEVEPIGDEKFNRWFFGTYSRPDIAKIWAAVDPRNSCVLWGMPGTPGRILVYNWVLKRGAVVEMDIAGMFTGYTSGISLDALDATYGNLDAIPLSLDDPSFQGGSPILLVADAANKLGAMTGTALQATLTLKNLEPTPGKRSRIREARLVSDTNTATVTIDARMKAGDAEFIRSTAAMRSNGKLPIRSNGRLNTVKVTIPAGTVWSYIQGCELEFEPGDGR